MFDYNKISEANKGITFTNVKGKNYAEVAQRVQAFRKICPEGFILTDLVSLEPSVVYMRAEVGYYEKDGRKVTLATGNAFEMRDASNVNKTSYIENCETSAIGRALGFLGLGSEKSIASAEEVQNAIDTQEAIESGKIEDPTKNSKPKRQDAPATVEKAATLPQEAPANPVLDYMGKEREALRKARAIDKAENNAIWTKQVEILRINGFIPDKALSTYTQKEAEQMVALMYTKFAPKGVELKADDGNVA